MDKPEMLTVNLQFTIPVRRDSAGRRIGIMNLLHPYLTDLGQTKELPCHEVQDEYDHYEKLNQAIQKLTDLNRLK